MVNIHLNDAALRRVAESPGMVAQCVTAGRAIADEIRSQGITVGDIDGGKHEIPLPVRVTDKAVVSLAHPAGIAVQAKHGSLTKGAAALGLEVKS